MITISRETSGIIAISKDQTSGNITISRETSGIIKISRETSDNPLRTVAFSMLNIFENTLSLKTWKQFRGRAKGAETAAPDHSAGCRQVGTIVQY